MDYMNDAERARRIIREIRYSTIATACPGRDQRPWNTPVYSAFDSEYNSFWASARDSQHSKNIRVNPHVFLVIYDSTISEGTGAGSGVYIEATAEELADPDRIARACQLLAGRVGKTPRPASYFLGAMPRRIYQASPERMWINDVVERHGCAVDTRVAVDLGALRAHDPSG